MLNIAIACPSVLRHKEENNYRVIRFDLKISETHKSRSMLWTNEQVTKFH